MNEKQENFFPNIAENIAFRMGYALTPRKKKYFEGGGSENLKPAATPYLGLDQPTHGSSNTSREPVPLKRYR